MSVVGDQPQIEFVFFRLIAGIRRLCALGGSCLGDTPGIGVENDAELVELGVDLNKITPFSYQSQDGQTVYLEEDCDAAHLVLRLKADCVPFEVVSESVNSDHWIRHLSSFQP